MEKPKKIEYSNGELNIVWQPEKCIHAGQCVKTLPRVYNPKARPWIKIENASTQELKDQIELCPSGALTYHTNKISNKEKSKSMSTKVEVMKNGPLLVSGEIEVVDQDGNIEKKEKRTAFCRCGHSGKQPYCDGSHKTQSFGV